MDRLPGGKGELVPPQFFDPEQVRIGVEHEMEHTTDRALAEEIAKDHLAEQILAGRPQDYYTRLEQMEMQDNRRWTRKYINDLPDSHFFWVAPGGEKDHEGKTTPRHLRSLPYKSRTGKVDLRHVRNALSRLDQTEDIPDSKKPSIRKKICGVLSQHGGECEMKTNRAPEDLEMSEQLLRDVRLEMMEGRVFRLLTWDTYRRDSMGKYVIGYRLEQIEPRAEAGIVFEGEDMAVSPLVAIDSDEALRHLLGFLTLRPGDTDADYFDDYTEHQMAFADEDAESLSLYAMDDDDEFDAPEFDDWED